MNPSGRNALFSASCGVSVILVNFKRLKNVQHIVELYSKSSTLSRYITDYVIWNNNRDLSLGCIDFPVVSKPCRVINSPSNLKDISKYAACMHALTPTCFFQDDDFVTVSYFRNLIHAYLADDSRLVVYTEPYTALTNMNWTSVSEHHELGFAWIGAGSVFSKHRAGLFFDFVQNSPLRRYSDVSDTFFSLHWGRMPTMLIGKLHSLPAHDGFGSLPGFGERISSAVIASQQYINMPQEVISRGPDIRAACALNDCNLLTDWKPICYHQHASEDWSYMTRQNLPHPDSHLVTSFVKFPYHHAVDGNLTTSWAVYPTPCRTSLNVFIGLQMFDETRITHLDIVATPTRVGELTASSDCHNWHSLPFTVHSTVGSTRIQLGRPLVSPVCVGVSLSFVSNFGRIFEFTALSFKKQTPLTTE